MEANGHQETTLPQLHILWDEKAQAVQLHFNPVDFRSWDFVLGLLEMAKGTAENKKRLTQMAQLQQAAKDAEIRRRLLNN